MQCDDRLTNWKRWCLARGLHQGQANSLEGAYRCPCRPDDTPTGWDDWLVTPPQIIREPLDRPDAVLVNRGYTMLALFTARQARIIKIMTFRSHWRPQWMAQKIGIHYLELDAAYANAKRMLFDQVALIESSVYKGATVQAVQLRVCEA